MGEPISPNPELNWKFPPNWDRVEDSDWAVNDESVQAQYPRQWVVAYKRQVVAASSDPEEARRLAAERTGEPLDEMIATWIAHPDDWFAE